MASLLELWPVCWSCGRFAGATAGVLRLLTRDHSRSPGIRVLKQTLVPLLQYSGRRRAPGAALAAALLDELGSIRYAAGGCNMEEGGHLQRGSRCPGNGHLQQGRRCLAQGHLLQDCRCHGGGCLLQGSRPPGGGHPQESSGSLPDHGGTAAWSCTLIYPSLSSISVGVFEHREQLRLPLGWKGEREKSGGIQGGICSSDADAPVMGICDEDADALAMGICYENADALVGGVCCEEADPLVMGTCREQASTCPTGSAAESCNPDLSFSSSCPSGRLRAPGAAAAAAWMEGRSGEVRNFAQVSIRVDCAVLAECRSVDGAGEPHFGKVVEVAEGGEAVTTPSSGHAHLVTPTYTSGSAWSIDQSLAGWAA